MVPHAGSSQIQFLNWWISATDAFPVKENLLMQTKSLVKKTTSYHDQSIQHQIGVCNNKKASLEGRVLLYDYQKPIQRFTGQWRVASTSWHIQATMRDVPNSTWQEEKNPWATYGSGSSDMADKAYSAGLANTKRLEDMTSACMFSFCHSQERQTLSLHGCSCTCVPSSNALLESGLFRC